MPVLPVVILLFIAWLITHGIFRMIVGTKCAFQGVEPPWVRNRQEKLTNREVRRAQRQEDARRTARGFIRRLWGDGWEFANKWLDDLGQDSADPASPTVPGAPTAEPLVPADAGASWVHDHLGDKAAAAAAWVADLWNRWWLPSQRQCPWTYPVLPDGAQCGRRVPKGCDYCAEHQVEAAVGHCLFGYGNPAMADCERPREGHFPWCSQHLDEWEQRGGQQLAAADQQATPEPAAAATADTPKAGTLDTPDTPTLDSTTETCRQSVDDGAGFGRPCGRPVPAGAATPDCGQHGAPVLPWDRPGCPWTLGDPSDPARSTQCAMPVPVGQRYCPTHEPLAVYDRAQYGLPPAPPADTEKPLCQWGRGATSESPDYGQDPCTKRAGAGGIHCLPHQIEYGRWEAGGTAPAQEPAGALGPAAEANPEQVLTARTFLCTIPVTLKDGSQRECGHELRMSNGTVEDCPVPHQLLADLQAERESATGDDTEVPPQRPVLRVVPNTEPQGDTSMSAPAQQSVGEATNYQRLEEFADNVINSGNSEWPAAVENAKQQAAGPGITNDAEIVAAFGQIDEAAKTLAGAGAALKAACAKHHGGQEQISSIGAAAATSTSAYRTQ